ncbi:heme oxygenase [Geomicrobium sp. JCM 19039]|uniref:heme oxygenase n=1 Tax=Geomicrobium sp. JCM 19039 TaxID=1460636 RepID=UPI00045F1356|nr:heme oxygenase [Geomicrobium sp. JCM 19039]GAK13984.1 heme-degrading monooxygenase IsdG [Geomicrobium sp. JCM 19039]
MVIVQNKTLITKGNGDLLVERFNKVGQIEHAEGFLGLEVLTNMKSKEQDEIVISTRWESKDDFYLWTKSQAFRDAHSGKNKRPDYIIGNEVSFFSVDVVRMPIAQAL